MDVVQLEKELNMTINNKALFRQAFTHSSYVNEHRKEVFSDNERLEFLGDAVLELGVSEHLYKIHPQMPEGEMTKLRASIVREASLASFARNLNFDQYLLLGKGEEQTGGRNRPALLADVFEACLGAIYLEHGFKKVLAFLDERVFPEINADAFSHAMDYKSQLQELVQQSKNQRIEYMLIEEKGPSHAKEFSVRVKINDDVFLPGVGRTKKEAEQRAAKHALDDLAR